MTERHDVRAPRRDVVDPRPKGTVRVRLIVEEWHGESWDREPDYNTTLATFSPDLVGPNGEGLHLVGSPLQVYLGAVKNAVKGINIELATADHWRCCGTWHADALSHCPHCFRSRHVCGTCGIAVVGEGWCVKHHPNTKPEYAAVWEKIRAQLDIAVKHAATPLGELREFRELLAHNELELAWDALFEAAPNPPGGFFWKPMARAAELMQLPEKAAAAEARSK